jgi:hypothetical protein
LDETGFGSRDEDRGRRGMRVSFMKGVRRESRGMVGETPDWTKSLVLCSRMVLSILKSKVNTSQTGEGNMIVSDGSGRMMEVIVLSLHLKETRKITKI